jgi:protein gp37
MADRSAIEWTDATWNPLRARRQLMDGTILMGWHCVHASEGCRNCYAEAFNRRLGTKLPYKPGHLIDPATGRGDVELILDESLLIDPIKWKKPRRIFVCSMTDLFADFVPDEAIDRMFAVMALCPQHTFQVLTKRPDRMRSYVTDRARMDWLNDEVEQLADRSGLVGNCVCRCGGDDGDIPWPLPNVWLGVSTEDQSTADERIPELLATPAAVRFLSCEPLLGLVDLRKLKPDGINFTLDALTGKGEHLLGFRGQTGAIHWVISGGESGPRARPMHPDWARSLRDQCAAAGVPFFFRQWGEWGPDTGPDKDFDRAGVQRDRVMEGAGPCAAWTGEGWRIERDGYLMPLERTGHEWVYRLGKKRNGRLLDSVAHEGMPA